MFVIGNSQNVTTYFKLRLTATGLEATGLTITALDLQYVRSGAAPSAKVDATALAATDSAHGDNQAIEVDATDQPGLYRVDWPDAAFAAGVREVILTVKHADCFSEDLRVTIDAPVNVAQVDGTAATDKLILQGITYVHTNTGTQKYAPVIIDDVQAAEIFTLNQLVIPSTRTGAFDGSALDLNAIGLPCVAVQQVGSYEEGPTWTGKIQESTTGTGDWTDVTGGGFTAVTEGSVFQTIYFTPTKRYIRYSGGVTGGTPGLALAVFAGKITLTT